MPWGFGIPKVFKKAYNAMPNMGVNSTVSRAYNSLPSFNPYGFGGGEGLDMGGIGMGGGMVDSHHNPAIIAAQHEQHKPDLSTQVMPYHQPEAQHDGGWQMPMPSMSDLASGLGSALYHTGSSLYNSAPDLGVNRAASGLAHAGNNIYQSLPSVHSVASGLGSMAGAAARGAGSLAGQAASAGIGYIPDQARSNMFQNAGSQLGGKIGGAISSHLPPSIGRGVNDYTTNFGKKFGDYLSSQFSSSPQSSFGGFKNVGATLGGGAAGALGGAGLGSVGGSALGGYLGGKLGKYGAPIGKVLGGLLGGGLGALGGSLGGGYLGNKFSGFERGGRVKHRRSTNKLMYNDRNPRHGLPRK